LKIFKLNGDDPIETEEFVLPSDLANRDDLNEITCKWMDDFNNLSPEERGEKYGGSFIEYMRAKLNAAPGSSAGQVSA
jgi:hypothetical protein